MKEIDLVRYCIRHMSSKQAVYMLFEENGLTFKKSDSFEKLSNRINESSGIELANIQQIYRSIWQPCPIEFHLSNLKSGSIDGHNWHGAMPSMLHLSMQNRVRDCIDRKISLDRLIAIGTDIMKHEYFMVATHDLCETMIIEKFHNVIPSLGSKSISDFIFNGIPYDLKNTNPILGLSRKEINENKAMVINKLLEGADVARLREQAKKTIGNWGLNRFYVIVESQHRWLSEPENVLLELIQECAELNDPIEIEIGGVNIQTQLVSI